MAKIKSATLKIKTTDDEPLDIELEPKIVEHFIEWCNKMPFTPKDTLQTFMNDPDQFWR